MLYFDYERETSLWLAQLEFSPDLICIDLMSHADVLFLGAVNDYITLYILWQT
jgi:hypothetical protein